MLFARLGFYLFTSGIKFDLSCSSFLKVGHHGNVKNHSLVAEGKHEVANALLAKRSVVVA